MTFDALHANHQTMEKVVVDKKGEFLIQVKDNTPVLHEVLERAFRTSRDAIKTAESFDHGHGRIETRKLQLVKISPVDTDWPHTFVACRVDRERQLLRREQVIDHSCEQSLYVGSFRSDTYAPEDVLALIRGHWSVENCLHHRKDRSMNEDRCRASARGIGRVMSCIRSLVTLVAGRTIESLSVIRRRFSRKTHLLVNLLFTNSLDQWEQKHKPYKRT